jgi:catechol 2,3-dioxygenase-like lactoylglutathione lyase family enzyme
MLSGWKTMAFIGTRDAGRARTFYRDVLGLKLLYEDNFAVVLDSNGVTLRIAIVPDLTPVRFTVLGWEVPDIEEAVTTLGKAGVELSRYPGMQQDERGIWNAPGGARVAWFNDPDGNVLSVSQH